MHPYRTHTCAALTLAEVGSQARLSGWVHRKRDHGGLLFVDLRDHFGLTQVVVDTDSPAFAVLERLRVESVVTVTGKVVARDRRDGQPRACRPARSRCAPQEVEVRSAAEELPMPVAGEQDYPEEIRLKYRYLDLRREKLHANIMLRSAVIASLRRRMVDAGLHRVPDADPDRLDRPRARATTWCRSRRPSGQVLRAAAGAADVQAAADGRRASTAISRSRPASATRTPAPTARRASSTSSTSR